MQRAIGSDIMMVLDQCIDSTSPHAEARAAMELHPPLGAALARGARRLAAGAVRDRAGRVLRGPAPRERRRADRDRGFDGFAIGGLAVGETQGRSARTSPS